MSTQIPSQPTKSPGLRVQLLVRHHGAGLTHVVLGILVAAAGVAMLQDRTWGRVIGIILAGLSLIANFLFIPYYPIWSLVIIELDIAAS